MAKQVIGIGSSANDGTGDSLRTAGGKINDNFTELYDDKQDKPTLTATVTLLTANWSANSQTVTVTGVTTTSINQIVLESQTMGDRWGATNVWATEQGTDSLTFSCETTPTQNIDFKVLIFK